MNSSNSQMFQQINSKYPDYHFRYLQVEDYKRNLFNTLNQLTNAPLPSFEDFQTQLTKMKTSAQDHANIVGIDKKTDKVVAFGTILICSGPDGRMGMIQNIVACSSVRGKGLGRCIIQILKWVGWERSCPKVSLFCEQKNVQFYNKLGFKREGVIYVWYGS